MSPTKSESSAAGLQEVTESAKSDTRSVNPGHEAGELVSKFKTYERFQMQSHLK